MLIAGVDLGGTEIKTGIVDTKKGILYKTAVSTEVALGADQIVKNIVRSIEKLTDINNIDAIGIGSPGSIDREKGIVKYSPNFPEWVNFELADKINRVTGKKTFVENDANAFTLGEWYFGNAKELTDFVCITLGTGVGSGVVTSGLFMTGKNGIGAELGHTTVLPNGPMCGCGNRGCLEAVASAKNTAKIAKQMCKKYPESDIIKLSGSIDKIESRHVFQALELNDTAAVLTTDFVTDYLAVAMGNFVHIFNPQKIIIGGGMSKAGDLLLDPIRKKVRKHIMPSFEGTFTIELSKLVEDAGILGAASTAIYRMEAE